MKKYYLKAPVLAKNKGFDMNKIIFSILSCMVLNHSVNAMEKYPLHMAVKEGDFELVEALLLSTNDTNVNVQDQNGDTPLHFAAETGNIKIVQFLLNRGANVNLPDKDGITPLGWAADEYYPEIFQLL